MRQILQNYRTGEVKVDEVTAPGYATKLNTSRVWEKRGYHLPISLRALSAESIQVGDRERRKCFGKVILDRW